MWIQGRTMRRPSGRCLAELLLVTVVGCVHPSGVCNGAAPGPDSLPPAASRGQREGDFEGGPANLPGHLPLAAAGPAAPTYQPLPALACQCRAAWTSNAANLLDREGDAVEQENQAGCLGPGRKVQEQANLKETILHDSALEVRNDAAGAALELYYRLAEAEAKSGVVLASIKEIDDALARTQELKAKGLKPPVEIEVLRRQRFDLLSDQARLQLRIEELNGGLRVLLGPDDCANNVRLWPVCPWHTVADLVDPHAAVAEGMAHRPELLLLRAVSARLDATTLSVVRQLLTSVNGLLGMAQKPPTCAALARLAGSLGCTSPATEAELEARRAELDQYRQERERQVRDTILADVRALPFQRDLLALAGAQVSAWQDEVRDLEDREARGIASYAEVSKARLEWLRARAKVIEEAAAWERAVVKLKRDQGVLVLECYPGTDGGCGGGGTE